MELVLCSSGQIMRHPPWKSHYSRRRVRYPIAKARLSEAACAPCIGGYVRVEA